MASTSTPQATHSNVREALAPSLPGASSHQLSKRQQCTYPPCLRATAALYPASLTHYPFYNDRTDDALLDAEAGPSSSTVLQASPASHPSFPAVAPLCRRYPSQASALFQTYLDLKNGAAAWDIVEPLALLTEDDYAEDGEDTAKDLVGLSDAEAEALIRERLKTLKTGTTKLRLADESDDGQELLRVGLVAIKGRRKDAKAYEIVIPLTISQHLRPAQLKAIFTLINSHAASCPPGEDVDTSHVLLAIIAQDSTLVYYLISQGMVKPIN